MRSWNSHSWYCIGILLALLIGTISVQWNNVASLPEIISFAVGLSSLILAVFAIVQSMTAGSDASATLSAVREAALDLRKTSQSVSNVVRDVQTTTGTVLEHSEASRIAIAEIQKDLSDKSRPDTNAIDPNEDNKKSSEFGSFTMGGGSALLAACLSWKNGRQFKFK